MTFCLNLLDIPKFCRMCGWLNGKFGELLAFGVFIRSGAFDAINMSQGDQTTEKTVIVNEWYELGESPEKKALTTPTERLDAEWRTAALKQLQAIASDPFDIFAGCYSPTSDVGTTNEASSKDLLWNGKKTQQQITEIASSCEDDDTDGNVDSSLCDSVVMCTTNGNTLSPWVIGVVSPPPVDGGCVGFQCPPYKTPISINSSGGSGGVKRKKKEEDYMTLEWTNGNKNRIRCAVCNEQLFAKCKHPNCFYYKTYDECNPFAGGHTIKRGPRPCSCRIKYW